jgi:hypothetical protein
MLETESFWRWLRAIEATRRPDTLAAVRQGLEAELASGDRRDLLALCTLQERRLERQPATSVATADPPTGQWSLTDLSTVLNASRRTDETIGGEIGRSPTAVWVLRLAIHQFQIFGGDRAAKSRLPPTVRAYLDAHPGARTCPQCGARF